MQRRSPGIVVKPWIVRVARCIRWIIAPALLASCASARLPAAEDDRATLLALHAEVMQAHRLSDVDLVLRSEPEDYVVANRGQVSQPTLAARRARLGPYLAATPVQRVRRRGCAAGQGVA